MDALFQRELAFDRLPEPERDHEHPDALRHVLGEQKKARQKIIRWLHEEEINNRFPTDDFWGNAKRFLERVRSGRAQGVNVLQMEERAWSILGCLRTLHCRDVAQGCCEILMLGEVDILDSEQPLKNWILFLPDYASGAKVPRRETFDASIKESGKTRKKVA